MNGRKVRRIFELVFGIPLLALGVLIATLDVFLWIRELAHPHPQGEKVETFLMGLLCGFPFWWLGYRLVFRYSWLALVDRGVSRLFRGKPRAGGVDDDRPNTG